MRAQPCAHRRALRPEHVGTIFGAGGQRGVGAFVARAMRQRAVCLDQRARIAQRGQPAARRLRTKRARRQNQRQRDQGGARADQIASSASGRPALR
jgi:hypothetical protein